MMEKLAVILAKPKACHLGIHPKLLQLQPMLNMEGGNPEIPGLKIGLICEGLSLKVKPVLMPVDVVQVLREVMHVFCGVGNQTSCNPQLCRG